MHLAHTLQSKHHINGLTLHLSVLPVLCNELMPTGIYNCLQSLAKIYLANYQINP